MDAGEGQGRGAGVTLADLDQSLPSEPLPEPDHRDCREWLDGVLARHGPDHRAMGALVLKLATIGSAISERLNEAALAWLSAGEIGRLMEGYLDFKRVIEEVLPKS